MLSLSITIEWILDMHEVGEGLLWSKVVDLRYLLLLLLSHTLFGNPLDTLLFRGLFIWFLQRLVLLLDFSGASPCHPRFVIKFRNQLIIFYFVPLELAFSSVFRCILLRWLYLILLLVKSTFLGDLNLLQRLADWISWIFSLHSSLLSLIADIVLIRDRGEVLSQLLIHELLALKRRKSGTDQALTNEITFIVLGCI